MLPSYSQITAAVKTLTGQESPFIINQKAMFLLNSQACDLPNSLFKYMKNKNSRIFKN